MALRRLYDQQGREVQLGKELFRGGEGVVHEVPQDSSSVAKLYHLPPTADKIAKLQWMVKSQSPELLRVAAWPVATLHENAPQGPLLGFVMPKVSGYKEIHQLYSLHSRRKEFPKADWMYMVHVAMNCAIAFECVHNHGHLVADVNQKNVLVSPNDATVRLLDCDSFQIRANGKDLVCEVGVPEYTPPEIQGVNFRQVVRNENHDRFGLAVLIFHLLFVGRHPFAGRYLGQGDMTLEQAIRELRFAYGSTASTKQVAPPPFALPLSLLPSELAQFFEQAFSEKTIQKGRPAAADWHRLLAALLKQIVTCSAEPAHRYPSHVGTCPWCQLLVAGGPAFFLSFHVGPLDFVCDIADLAALWGQLEQIRRPSVSVPAITGFSPKTPTPPSPAIVASRKHLQVAKVVAYFLSTVSVMAFSLFLALWSPLAGIIALAALVSVLVPAAYWLYWSRRSAYSREYQQRKARFEAARESFRAVEGEWQKSTSSALSASLQSHRAKLEQLKDEYAKLKAEYEQDRKKLWEHREEAQRKDFLESVLIENHDIDRIKRGRKDTLRSHLFVTAYDVLSKPDELSQVPGFGGAVLKNALLQWAQQMAASFKFDPNRGVPENDRRALVWKYQQKKIHCKGQLERGVEELRQHTNRIEQQLQQTAGHLLQARNSAHQAWSDLSVL